METLCEEREVILPILLPGSNINSQSFVNVNTRHNHTHCLLFLEWSQPFVFLEEKHCMKCPSKGSGRKASSESPPEGLPRPSAMWQADIRVTYSSQTQKPIAFLCLSPQVRLRGAVPLSMSCCLLHVATGPINHCFREGGKRSL